SAGCLARRSRREENLLQHGVSLESWIIEVCGQSRFLQVHDVFSTARCGPHENQAAEYRGSVTGNLLRDHSTEGEPEHVAVVQPQAVQEIEGMRRHLPDCSRHRAGGSSNACVIEQDDFSL